MKKIWIFTFLGLLAGTLVFMYWTEVEFNIWTKPEHSVWGATIVLAFMLPTVCLIYAWLRTSSLNNLIGKDYPGRSEEHFKLIVKTLCRRWNGEATINLISLQLVSSYDLRRELLKRNNYLELIKKILRANRFNFANSRHSHIDCLDAVREVILETEVAFFKKKLDYILKEKRDPVFLISASTFLAIELPITLCILGYNKSYQLIDEIMRIFERLDPKEHHELLSSVEKRAELQNLPTTGRGEDVRMTFRSMTNEIREKLAEKYIVIPA